MGTIAIVNPKTIDFGGMNYDKVETTNLSTTGGRTFKPVPLGEEEEITVESIYDAANYLALSAIVGVAGKALSAVVKGATTDRTITGTGWIKSCKPKANGAVELDTLTTVFQPDSAITVA